ncbi:S-adenosylmethionine-dependent methyltransferase NDAI_0J01060 [Naumovozyma dairenensis CBS 421]|uniref:Methyltransferase small domain-containing protein n=1 Tax=Naumovozyma dairenensis (strain ATCC 10597 / BCRC 20456 / CBS 421 / NBRC 0211 / NRRL Y-12639) TaxID=1071378 RepID=G0WGS0_NAUDC|nr:hypothetical protein NDAI_0J01060 [Naumovozyma dairenensis CBS 421]CCD26998.1 hypothetical protein NDAI_0J01060 [Naumovozyma dairenensis CBS 421]
MLPTPYIKCDYDKVYEPSEDSFLLLDSLEKDLEYLAQKFKNKLALVCEIGPGSGIITTFMIQNHIPTTNNNSVYYAFDINPWALEATLDTVKLNRAKDNDNNNAGSKSSLLEPVQVDLTSSWRSNQIDLLVFNPPYVPSETIPTRPERKEELDTWVDLALEGGKDGMEITNRVLAQLDTILTPNGIAYILFCARNKPEEIIKSMKENGYSNWNIELVKNRKAGWEVLSVYRFSRC